MMADRKPTRRNALPLLVAAALVLCMPKAEAQPPRDRIAERLGHAAALAAAGDRAGALRSYREAFQMAPTRIAADALARAQTMHTLNAPEEALMWFRMAIRHQPCGGPEADAAHRAILDLTGRLEPPLLLVCPGMGHQPTPPAPRH